MTEQNFAELLKIRQLRENYVPPADNIVFKIENKNMQLPENRRKLAYFDTESADVEFYNQADKIKKFSGLQGFHDRLLMYQVREDSPGTIRKMIHHLAETDSEISVFVVDGLLDLCINYNDEKETRLLTNWLKMITKKYNILIISVIHLGKKDGETLGHLGSNSDRWAQSTLTITKDKVNKTFILESKFLRSADDIQPIIVQNIGGYWQSVSGLSDQSEEAETILLNSVLQSEKNYKQLVDEIMKRNNRGMNYAKNLIKKWIETNKIEKTAKGYKIVNFF
jgi:hypothetical protein